MVELYEAAAEGYPTNEEILTQLFMAYVRVGDYQKQQQVHQAPPSLPLPPFPSFLLYHCFPHPFPLPFPLLIRPYHHFTPPLPPPPPPLSSLQAAVQLTKHYSGNGPYYCWRVMSILVAV